MVQTDLSDFEKKLIKIKFEKVDTVRKGEIDFGQFQEMNKIAIQLYCIESKWIFCQKELLVSFGFSYAEDDLREIFRGKFQKPKIRFEEFIELLQHIMTIPDSQVSNVQFCVFS